MPEEQLGALEAFLLEYNKSLEEIPFDDETQSLIPALETRAMALVLSGAIPPYIDLRETYLAVQLVLDNPASLLPSKGTDEPVRFR